MYACVRTCIEPDTQRVQVRMEELMISFLIYIYEEGSRMYISGRISYIYREMKKNGIYGC